MSPTSLLVKGALAVLPSGNRVIVLGMTREAVALAYEGVGYKTSSIVDLTVVREWFRKYARAVA